MLKNGIIWIVGLVIALTAGLSAMGAIAKNKAPELAVSLQPANGFAFETLASNSLKAAVAANDGQFPNSVDPVAANSAKQAFLSEPVTPEAIALLALGSAEGNTRELMHEAFALSRRQQLVIGWMIADSGAREDIPAILSHYDTMLRTSSSAASVVIPMMAGALANTDFVEPFAGLLSKKPPWVSRFWGAVVATPEAIGNAAILRKRLYDHTESDENYRDPDLVSALVKNRQFEEAEELYNLLSNEPSSASLINNGSFQREPKYPPFDWQLFSTGEYGALITNDALQLSAIRGSGGIFARQLVKLPNTITEISVKSSKIAHKNADLSIQISCAENNPNKPKAITIRILNEALLQKISNVNSGCSFFWFDTVGRADENGNGFDVSVTNISLKAD